MNYEDETLVGFVMNRGFDRVESYIRRGRFYRNSELLYLRERWLLLMKEFCEASMDNQSELDDIQSELDLREENPPYELIMKDLRKIGKFFKEELRELEKNDPERMKEINEEVIDDLVEYMSKKHNPSS